MPGNRPRGAHFRQRFYGTHATREAHPNYAVRRMEKYTHALLGKPKDQWRGIGILGESSKSIREKVYRGLRGDLNHPYRDILLLEMMVLFAHHHSLSNTALRKMAQESLRGMGIIPPSRSAPKK